MRLFRKLWLLLLVVSMLFALTGCNEPDDIGNIDWTLHGQWVTSDGEVLESMDFSVSGSLPTEYEPQCIVEMKLEFNWPDSFGYRSEEEGEMTYVGGADVADKHNNQPIYHGNGWLISTKANDVAGLSFTICPAEGFLVIRVGNETDLLVASTDPNADIAEILEFYKEYVH